MQSSYAGWHRSTTNVEQGRATRLIGKTIR